MTTVARTASHASTAAATVFPILFAISIVHLLNDVMQSTVSALFPILRDSLSLSYKQIGLIAFAMNMTASILQPIVGTYADIRPRPYILPIGVCFTLAGIVMLALAPNFALILLAVTAMGIGSAIFHPESSRVAYLAAGGKRGLAQSIFQVGGNIGSSLGPILTAVLFVPLGQIGVIWFTFVAIAGIVIQYYVAGWYRRQNIAPRASAKRTAQEARIGSLSRFQIVSAIVILVFLVFSKHVYMSSITSFYTFYLIDDYGVTVEHAQLFLFAFLVATAAGTFFGGPLADRFGRRNIIWLSILGTAPFSILLPYADLFWSGVLCVCAGFVLSSAFSIIVVYAQELLPGNVGLVSGLFFGLAFGLGGLGSVVLGWIADATSIAYIMKLCAYLPLLGVLAILLPKDRKPEAA
ncbi:MFS transporter [Paenibacillus mesophilus]|uniref:MFS transporter n=1 Tax=Paenibacillus mesophilus TaxID=2582849 RepID=UPI00110D5F03|nr:MFS transporter [Paenibacillus mesophilus]TMV45836.1 MFS transporter [Paenibacillus mesophilus]